MPERNVVSWTAMVAGYANSGKVSTAREIFDEMLEKNAVLWTAVIVGYGKCGDVRGAQQVFDEICVLDATSWGAMIACYAQNGFSSEAIEMYWKMRSLNEKANENYNAKISHCGLPKNGPHGENSHVSTCVMGPLGYVAPEYEATGLVCVKSDVYCFGIVLLEMLSGMRAVDRNRPSEQHSLVKWAEPYLSDRSEVLSRVMDRRLEGRYPSEGAVQAARLILQCLGHVPRDRPSMTEVVEALEQIQAIKHDP
ncbi:hypothetical protein MRB53_000204 [Persea americana]|uniref:Uncharacterized protein n=1 Tax=Persea americana TaxID=3435 RepID=A0ACC2MP46_PERAE|nr:hypothetical protein MRB53_000204 [Persea americana]